MKRYIIDKKEPRAARTRHVCDVFGETRPSARGAQKSDDHSEGRLSSPG